MQEIVICGGGIAGAAAACILSNLDYSITLLEKDSREEVGNVRRGETLRSEVTKVLTEYGLMPYLESQDSIIRMGEVREFFHTEYGKLGNFKYDYLSPEYPVIHSSHRQMVDALHKWLEEKTKVRVRFKTRAVEIGDFKDGKRNVTLLRKDDGSQLEVKGNLVVVADGAGSRFRTIFRIPTDHFDYRVGYLMFYLQRPKDMKWGRFYVGPNGFIGIFPTSGNMIRAAVEVRIEDLRDWLTSPVEEQKRRLVARCPILGECSIQDVGVFYHVLKRHASHYTMDGLCLIGDSAHTTHPMQAQGISLVFNDIVALHNTLKKNQGKMLTNDVLKEYEEAARPFNSSVLENNHTLFRLFEEIGQDKTVFDRSLPILKKMGFETMQETVHLESGSKS